jgi:hypothetical protein
MARFVDFIFLRRGEFIRKSKRFQFSTEHCAALHSNRLGSTVLFVDILPFKISEE